MILLAGERLRLKDKSNFYQMMKGIIEVYAVNTDKANYRKEYLLAREENEIIYPNSVMDSNIEFELQAIDDSELVSRPMGELMLDAHVKAMNAWFADLTGLPWLKALADGDSQVLQIWRNNGLFSNGFARDEIINIFRANERFFMVMLSEHFQAQDNKMSERLRLFQKNHNQLIDETISYLMDEEPVVYAADITGNGKQEEASMILRRIAKAMSMDEPNMELASDLAERIDQLGLIRRLSQKANIRLRLVTLTPEWYKQDCGVFLGYYGSAKELAALIPDSPHSYRIITYKNPDGRYVNAEVNAELSRSAFICYAGLPKKVIQAKHVIKFIYHHCWKNDFSALLLASLIAGIVATILPSITETVFQDIVPIMDAQSLTTVTQVGVVASFTTALVSIVRSVAAMRLRSRIEMGVEAALFSRLLELPVKFFRRYESGELAQRIVGMNAVKSVLGSQSLNILFDAVFSFWSLLLMCWYSVKLALTSMLLWLVYCVVMALIYRRTVYLQREMITARNKTASLVQQIFAGLSKFRMQGAEEQAYNLWGRMFSVEWKWNMKKRWQSNYANIIFAVQPLIFSLIIYVIIANDMKTALEAGKEVSKEVIGYAEFMAFQTAFTGFNTTLNAAIPVISNFLTLKPQWENIQPILKELPEVSDDKADASALEGNIEISHLRFAYEADGPEILKGINLKIKAGEYVAIVGASGCGKSTFLRLMLGFETPKQGGVYYDGQDLEDLNLSSVRSQMGVVLQNGQLMSGDIFSNIVGTMAISQDDAWAAAEAAGIADDIRKMPMGMQTIISEGSNNISGGQRQRILIARALAAKPAIVIFDEATSALDNRTQSIVTDSLKKMKATRIVVAHRLSTIRHCDRIIVFDQGQIAESGNYDSLMEKNGLFAVLAKRQLA